MDTKPILVSTPRGDKSPFDDFWKIKRSELKDFAKTYRDAMRSTPKVEKLLRQRRKQMQNNVAEYKSDKSNSTYTVTTENGRAYIGVTGEASTNPKVIAEKERIRKSGGDDVGLVKWIARKLANTY